MLLAIIIASSLGIGIILGAAAMAIYYEARDPDRPRLPPATRRQLARAARANRADIRRAQHDQRHWLPPSIDDFDHEETQ